MAHPSASSCPFSSGPGGVGRSIGHAEINEDADERIKRVLTNDPMMGIFRHGDAGYEIARHCADEQGVKIPMR
jgi:urocanate hydratase